MSITRLHNLHINFAHIVPLQSAQKPRSVQKPRCCAYTLPKSRCLYILSTICLLLIVDTAVALPDDSQQRLTLEAQSAEFDEAKGVTTYTGDVVMAQGSMKIEAEKLIIFGELNSANRVLATGIPARFEQKPDPETQTVKAIANRLDYKVQTETLVLTGDASLEQEGNSLKSGRIEYDVKRSLVKAGSDTDTPSPSDRVRMVIPPKSSKRKLDSTATP